MEEIKQKARENWKNEYPLNTLKGESRKEFEEFIETLLSQALEKRDMQIIEIIKNFNPEYGELGVVIPNFKERLISTLTTK